MANLDIFRIVESKQSSVGFEPWTPWLEGNALTTELKCDHTLASC